MILDENNFRGATTDSFDADRAGACEKIEEARSGDAWAKHVEERFAQAVARGAQREAFQTL
jgi:hypothetical protein